MKLFIIIAGVVLFVVFTSCNSNSNIRSAFQGRQSLLAGEIKRWGEVIARAKIEKQ